MLKKYTLLYLGLLIGSQTNGITQPQAQSAIDWKSIWLYLNDRSDKGSDVVHYKSRKENGKFIVEVAARAYSWEQFDQYQSLPDESVRKSVTRKDYADQSMVSSEKSVIEFYRCMSELENPERAVRSGEYRKCVKTAWEFRPWFTPAEIDVRERRSYEPNDVSWNRYSFDRFERKYLPQSFLN